MKMSRWLAANCAVCLFAGAAFAGEPRGADSATLKTAVEKGLGLLVKTSPNFIKRGGCNSCHSQHLPALAQAVARKRGIDAGPDIAQMEGLQTDFSPERALEFIVTGGANSIGYSMLNSEARKRPADIATDSFVHYLQSTQETDGRWRTIGNRPPMTYDDVTTTAMAARSLQVYAPESQREDVQKRIGRAGAWLLEVKPRSNHERVYRLLGISWTKAGRQAIQGAVRDLRAEQQADGGWAQLPTMQSDAYATGQALYALNQAGGVPATDPAYRRGVQYLLRTQAEDGSWHVKTRALPVQPYFDSGFPYGHDQWISSAGTSWAAMALALAVEPVKISSR